MEKEKINKMEILDLILSSIEEKICEDLDVLVRRNFTCCESCGDIQILREPGYSEFDGYMFYPINQNIKWKKQLENKDIDYLQIEWFWNVTDDEDNFITLCENICKTINKISKHIAISGKTPNEPLIMKIKKCLFM